MSADDTTDNPLPPEYESTADKPYDPGVIGRAHSRLADAIDQKIPWYKLPKLLGLIELVGIRNTLREKNLFDTSRLPAVNPTQPPPYEAKFLTERSPDGSWNDLEHAEMGMANTRFGRNVPIENTWPDEDRLLTPNPREISRRLMTRETLNAATGGNALIAAWLQFMIRDWFKHKPGPRANAWVIPQVEGDDWPSQPVIVRRSTPDPTSPPDSDLPPTFLNTNTHWWDGSSVYGNSLAEQQVLRTHEGGKLLLVDGLPPGAADAATRPGFWLGVGMLQTLFAMEHNAIVEALAEAHPDFDDETLFQKGRLITSALLAKIHTVEWTPAVTAHPTAVAALHANWWGLQGERLHRLFGRITDNEAISGIVGGETDDFGVPYALTEEFVAVYRMHPLVPDDYDFRSALDDSPTLGAKEFGELTGMQTIDIMRENKLADLVYTFGTMNPGLVTLHNFPRALQQFVRPDNGELMDLAAIDIVRCREMGVPRYCEFRRLLHLPVPESFEDLTSNEVWARELHDVYGGKLEDLDLIPGLMAEDFPEGFAFSDTAFRIFALMASRRLNSDRFFTTHFTDEVYTEAGMKWLEDNTMNTVLMRHFPELSRYVQDLPNAFAIWARPGSDE